MDWSNPWLIGILALVVGIALGAGIMMLIARRSTDDKAVTALREEFDDYRDNVNEHFEKTSDLFRDMTERYVDVYNHLAGGAQQFGKDLDAAPRLEMVEHDAITDAEEAEPVEPIEPKIVDHEPLREA